MAQVTIYMNDETEARMRAAARSAGVSMSAWLAGLVHDRTRDVWPPEVAALAGVWSCFPSADELREGAGVDVPREEL